MITSFYKQFSPGISGSGSGIGSGFRVLRQISGFGSGFGFNKFSGSGSGIQLCRISKTRLLFAVFGFDKNFPNFSFV